VHPYDFQTAEAIELFNSIEKRNFTVLHCWQMLRDQPTFMELHDQPSKGDTFVDLDGDEGGDSASHAEDSNSPAGSKRPVGRDSSKAAKKSSSSTSVGQSSGDFASLMSTLHVEKMGFIKEENAGMKEKLSEMLEMDRQKIALKAEEITMKKIEQDHKILGMDLTTLNPMQRVMYEKLQQETLARWMSRGNPSSDP
jgi:hypothetical protein